MLKILHLSDLHLGWRPSTLAPERALAWESRRNSVLRKAVDHALAQGIQLVVIAGNLFDRHDPPGPLARATLIELRRLVSAGCTLVTAPGPRDGLVYPDSAYRKAEGEWPGTLIETLRPAAVLTTRIGDTPVHLYGLACSGAPSPRGRVLRDFPRNHEPGIHVAVYPGVVDDTGPSTLPRLDAEALGEVGYDYLALGGIPDHQVRKVGETQAAYPGTVEALGFDHPGCGRWTIVEAEGRGRTRITTTPVEIEPVFQQTLDVTGHADDAQVRASLGAAADARAMARFVLQGLSIGTIEPPVLESQLGDQFFHLEVVDRTRMDVERLGQEEPGSLLSRFVGVLSAQVRATSDPGEQQMLDHALRAGVAVLRKEVPAR